MNYDQLLTATAKLGYKAKFIVIGTKITREQVACELGLMQLWLRDEFAIDVTWRVSIHKYSYTLLWWKKKIKMNSPFQYYNNFVALQEGILQAVEKITIHKPQQIVSKT